jgi:hypothetical protein
VLLGSAYFNPSSPPSQGGVMTHVQTFDGHLNITFSYTSPHFTKSWAESFLAAMLLVLKLLSEDKDLAVEDVFKKIRKIVN